jgi:ditrans,polycis-polyprenyl diphosphate synthase
MFSPWSWLSAQAQSCLLDVLTAGPIPKHVAFVMDGNRRYARSKQKAVYEGHSEGFIALRRTLEICLRLNIRCVSVYAFAIDNFNRPKDEVDALMALAEEKLNELCQKGDLLEEYGVRLNIIGRKELLPPTVQQAAQRAEDLTRHNDKCV